MAKKDNIKSIQAGQTENDLFSRIIASRKKISSGKEEKKTTAKEGN